MKPINRETFAPLFSDLTDHQFALINCLYDVYDMPNFLYNSYSATDLIEKSMVSETTFRGILNRMGLKFKDRYNIEDSFLIVMEINKIDLEKRIIEKQNCLNGRSPVSVKDTGNQIGVK